MNVEGYIAIGSLIISLLAIVISLKHHIKEQEVKAFELSCDEVREILAWSSEVNEILIHSRLLIKTGGKVSTSQLAKLSALIEHGRFYLPNLHKDKYGLHKPMIYRGLRNVILDFLIYSYDILCKNNANHYQKHLEVLQRLFTSHVYSLLKERKNSKQLNKLAIGDGDMNQCREEFFASDARCWKNWFPE